MVVNRTPLIGEHTTELLSDVLGYDEDKITSLRKAEVIKSQESIEAAD